MNNHLPPASVFAEHRDRKQVIIHDNNKGLIFTYIHMSTMCANNILYENMLSDCIYMWLQLHLFKEHLFTSEWRGGTPGGSAFLLVP